MTYQSISQRVADTAMMGLGFQIVATMYQITLTLSLILNEFSVKEANNRRFYFYLFLCVCMFLQVLSLILVYTNSENPRKDRYRLEAIFYSFLTLIYFTIFCLLNKKMSHLDIETIHTDKISVKSQFGVFMFAFATRTVYYLMQMVFMSFNYYTALL